MYQTCIISPMKALFGLQKEFKAEDGGKSRVISFQEKTANNILKGIEASKQIPFDRVLYALGIRNVGETVSKENSLSL